MSSDSPPIAGFACLGSIPVTRLGDVHKHGWVSRAKMTNGDLLGCRTDAKEEILRFVARAPNYVLNSNAMIHSLGNTLDSTNFVCLGKNDGGQILGNTILADDFDGHLGKGIKCHGLWWQCGNSIASGRPSGEK